jgi:hypothetical protein
LLLTLCHLEHVTQVEEQGGGGGGLSGHLEVLDLGEGAREVDEEVEEQL